MIVSKSRDYDYEKWETAGSEAFYYQAGAAGFLDFCIRIHKDKIYFYEPYSNLPDYIEIPDYFVDIFSPTDVELEMFKIEKGFDFPMKEISQLKSKVNNRGNPWFK